MQSTNDSTRVDNRFDNSDRNKGREIQQKQSTIVNKKQPKSFADDEEEAPIAVKTPQGVSMVSDQDLQFLSSLSQEDLQNIANQNNSAQAPIDKLSEKSKAAKTNKSASTSSTPISDEVAKDMPAEKSPINKPGVFRPSKTNATKTPAAASEGESFSKLGEEYEKRNFESPKDARIVRVAIIGNPNAGKSTLTNKIINHKVSAVSPKAQTTRTNIIGVLTEENTQYIFYDTPGIISQSKNPQL